MNRNKKKEYRLAFTKVKHYGCHIDNGCSCSPSWPLIFIVMNRVWLSLVQCLLKTCLFRTGWLLWLRYCCLHLSREPLIHARHCTSLGPQQYTHQVWSWSDESLSRKSKDKHIDIQRLLHQQLDEKLHIMISGLIAFRRHAGIPAHRRVCEKKNLWFDTSQELRGAFTLNHTSRPTYANQQ